MLFTATTLVGLADGSVSSTYRRWTTVRPKVGSFRALDFLQASAILRAAEPVKAEVRDKLSALLDR